MSSFDPSAPKSAPSSRRSSLAATLLIAALCLAGSCPPQPSYQANVAAWNAGNNLPWITPSVTPGTPSLVVTLAASVKDSASPPRPITSCLWNFGDGSPVATTTLTSVGDHYDCAPVTHTYAYAGVYQAVVQASTAAGPMAQTVVEVDTGSTVTSVVEEDVVIGGCLQAHLWRPEPRASRPTIVQFSPYTPEQFSLHLDPLVRSGYNSLHVVERGQGNSCDTNIDLYGQRDQEDLLLIDEWLYQRSLDASPWANGKFCLTGYSGPAILGGLAVAHNTPPPHPPSTTSNLACAVLGGGHFDWYDGGLTKNGAKWPILPFFLVQNYGSAPTPASADARIPHLLDFLLEMHVRAKDVFWEERDQRRNVASSPVPMLLFTSYEDAMSATPLPYLAHVGTFTNPFSAVLLYIGAHDPFDATLERPTTAFPNPGMIFTAEVRRFFDYFLLGRGTLDTNTYDVRFAAQYGGAQAAFVNAQTAGWVAATSWPPTGYVPLTLRLDQVASNTVASRGDYSLVNGLTVTSPLTFGYRPPEVFDPGLTFAGIYPNYTFPDMRRLERDALTFTTGPLPAGLHIGGDVTLHLRASSTLYDWDWMAMLDDVWPDGSAHRLSSGLLRASARNGLYAYDPAPVGMQDYYVTMSQTAAVSRSSHRLRLSIYQLNTTDASPATASTTIDVTDTQLRLSVASGTVFPEQSACTGASCISSPSETFDWKTAFLTLGYAGHYAGNHTLRLGGGIMDATYANPPRGVSGRVFVEHDSVVSKCDVTGITGSLLAVEPAGVVADLDCDEASGAEYRVRLHCDVEGNNGSVEVIAPAGIGALMHDAGLVQCFDTLFNNVQPPS